MNKPLPLVDDADGRPNLDSDEPVNVWLVGQQASPTQRRHRYTPESFEHPAKMLPALASKIIRTYSAERDLVVDPMSGIGTTAVEALWLNRRYVGIELEPRFAELQLKNIDLAIAAAAPSIDARVVCADARLATDLSDASLVLFSPPYQDAIHNQGNELARIARKIENGTASLELRRRFSNWDPAREGAQAGTRSAGYSRNAGNVGHLKGDRYWEAMREIYARSYEMLREGGYLAVVTKEQRDRKTGELTNLYSDTVSVCRELGFALHQHIAAILCRIDTDSLKITPRTSHWQRMAVPRAAEKGTVNLLGQFEDVIVFRKPGEHRRTTP